MSLQRRQLFVVIEWLLRLDDLWTAFWHRTGYGTKARLLTRSALYSMQSFILWVSLVGSVMWLINYTSVDWRACNALRGLLTTTKLPPVLSIALETVSVEMHSGRLDQQAFVVGHVAKGCHTALFLKRLNKTLANRCARSSEADPGFLRSWFSWLFHYAALDQRRVTVC